MPVGASSGSTRREGGSLDDVMDGNDGDDGGNEEAYTSSHALACPACSVRTSPVDVSFPHTISPGQTWRKTTYNHLFILRNLDPFPLRHLQILQPAQHLVLHDESGLHAELGPFLDGEGFRFERLDGPRGGQVDGDVGAAFDFEGEGLDDAAALVFGVHVDGRGRGNAQRGFPAIEGFIVLVWERGSMLGRFFFWCKRRMTTERRCR